MTFATPLEEFAARRSRADVARELGVDTRTVRRWLKGETTVPRQAQLLIEAKTQPRLPLAPTFTFIDLFAGVGGIRRAFEHIGGQCVFTSEWDTYAQKTYEANWPSGPDHVFAGDITAVNASEVPDHDVLLAGFPCQPFSIAGVSKKNALGRAHGFADATQGTLFFDVARIIDEKRPKAFLLENVKNLKSHDKGRTFKVIMATLEEELGYHVQTRIVDGAPFTPQHRERIMIVGFRDANDFDFQELLVPDDRPTIETILHRTDGTEPYLPHDGNRYFDHANREVLAKYTLTPRLWAYLQDYAAKHKAAGNGFGYGLVRPGMQTRTLSARYYKDGSEILVEQPGGRPRRLTPRECARLMGYPDDFVIPVSDTRAYKQFGNSVVVPAIESVAKLMKEHIEATVTPAP